MTRIQHSLGWLLAAALSAYASSLVVSYPTPVDEALPLMAVLLTAVAAASHVSVMTAIPALMVGEMLLVDERLRLLWFGLVIAVTFAGSLGVGAGDSPARTAGPAAPGQKLVRAAVIVASAIILLRWIPLSDVRWFRELLLLAIAIAIVAVWRGTALSIAVAVVVALITPAVPLRSFVFALAALAAIIALQYFGAARFEGRLLAAVVVGLPLLLFAWSGIVARAFPLVVQRWRPAAPRELINAALAANEHVEFWVRGDARALIVSGANVPRLPKGTLLGRIDPGNVPIRIGDAADWGYLRRDHWFGTRNPLPRDPAGIVRGYGYDAWIDGAGRVALPPRAYRLRVTADANLPPGASLQVEGLELERR